TFGGGFEESRELGTREERQGLVERAPASLPELAFLPGLDVGLVAEHVEDDLALTLPLSRDVRSDGTWEETPTHASFLSAFFHGRLLGVLAGVDDALREDPVAALRRHEQKLDPIALLSKGDSPRLGEPDHGSLACDR